MFHLAMYLCRSLRVLLATVLCVCTFAMMVVFQATRNSYKTLPHQHRTLNSLNDHIGVNNSLYVVLHWKLLQDVPRNNSHNDNLNWSSNPSYKNVPKDTFLFQHIGNNKTRMDIQNSTNGSSYEEKASYFRHRLTGVSAELLKETIRVFDLVMTTNHIHYTMYGGTLIGSYRHHGFVPWDDDVDILAPYSARNLMFRAFTDIAPQYILNTDMEHCWKLFSAFSDPIHGCNWSWPYLDIFFYAENETHIWDTSPKYTQNFVYLREIVFPFRRRPFLDLFLPAPHNPQAVIDTNYDIDLCKSGAWIHKWERIGMEITLPCSVLFSKFPFVQRTFMNGGCNETLVQNGDIIHIFFDQKYKC